MQNKDQPLQICKWNSCSMLFKFLGTISQRMTWVPFCPNDLNHYVDGTSRKFAVARLVVPIVWPIQKGTNLTQNELITLEEVGFSFWLPP